MSRNLWLVIIAVFALGGIVGGVMVLVIAPSSTAITMETNPASPVAPAPSETTIIIEKAPPPVEKPRAKSHHINPGISDKI
jgi:hypothetical protein